VQNRGALTNVPSLDHQARAKNNSISSQFNWPQRNEERREKAREEDLPEQQGVAIGHGFLELHPPNAVLELVIATPDPLLPVEGPNALIVVVAPSNMKEREERRSMAAEGGYIEVIVG
jgi:hypothetical protein